MHGLHAVQGPASAGRLAWVRLHSFPPVRLVHAHHPRVHMYAEGQHYGAACMTPWNGAEAVDAQKPGSPDPPRSYHRKSYIIHSEKNKGAVAHARGGGVFVTRAPSSPLRPPRPLVPILPGAQCPGGAACERAGLMVRARARTARYRRIIFVTPAPFGALWPADCSPMDFPGARARHPSWVCSEPRVEASGRLVEGWGRC